MSYRTNGSDLDRFRILVAELRAIEMWDSAYWRKHRPEPWETAAFVARCQRRVEILLQLLRTQKQGAEEEDSEKKWSESRTSAAS